MAIQMLLDMKKAMEVGKYYPAGIIFGTDKNGDKSRTFIHLSHSFNDEGEIFREVLWVE
jgi:hypothetical protein